MPFDEFDEKEISAFDKLSSHVSDYFKPLFKGTPNVLKLDDRKLKI